MHTTPFESKLKNYGNNATAEMRICRAGSKGLIVEKAECVHAELTRAGAPTLIKKIAIDMFLLVDSAASDGIRTESAWFSDTILIDLFIWKAAEDPI